MELSEDENIQNFIRYSCFRLLTLLSLLGCFSSILPASSCVMKGKTESGGRQGLQCFQHHFMCTRIMPQMPWERVFLWYISSVPGCIFCKYMHDYCIGHKSLQLPKHSLDLGWLAMWREVHVPTSSCLDIPHFVTQNLIGRMEEEEVGWSVI